MNESMLLLLSTTAWRTYRINSSSPRWETNVAPKICNWEVLKLERFWFCTHVYTYLMCTFECRLWNGCNKYTASMHCSGMDLLHAGPASSWSAMPIWAAAASTLTRTTSSSLFLCMSCFSSSTILDMASFSVSCSFSESCEIVTKKQKHSKQVLRPLESHILANRGHYSLAYILRIIFWEH